MNDINKLKVHFVEKASISLPENIFHSWNLSYTVAFCNTLLWFCL